MAALAAYDPVMGSMAAQRPQQHLPEQLAVIFTAPNDTSRVQHVNIHHAAAYQYVTQRGWVSAAHQSAGRIRQRAAAGGPLIDLYVADFQSTGHNGASIDSRSVISGVDNP